MPSDRIIAAEAERRALRDAVVSLVEPEFSGIRGELSNVRDAQQAHELRDIKRHEKVLGAIKDVAEHIDDRITRALEHRAERTTSPGGGNDVASALSVLAGQVQALVDRKPQGVSAGLGALLGSAAGWPWVAWVLIAASITGSTAAVGAVAAYAPAAAQAALTGAP